MIESKPTYDSARISSAIFLFSTSSSITVSADNERKEERRRENVERNGLSYCEVKPANVWFDVSLVANLDLCK